MRFVDESGAAKALGLTVKMLQDAVARKKLPGPDPDFGLYDLKALDVACDRISGLGSAKNALDAWKERKSGSRAA